VNVLGQYGRGHALMQLMHGSLHVSLISAQSTLQLTVCHIVYLSVAG
jgi:hypothetical protein